MPHLPWDPVVLSPARTIENMTECVLPLLATLFFGRKTLAISHKKKKKNLSGRECYFNFFVIGHRKLIPKQQRMNFKREQAHKQLMSELRLGLDQALNSASINNCSHSFLSVTNQWHILLTSSSWGTQTSTYMSESWRISKHKKHYQKLCSSLWMQKFSHENRYSLEKYWTIHAYS